MASNLTRAFIFRENGKTILYRVLPDGDREIHMADADAVYADMPINMAEVVEADFNDAASLISYKPICTIGFKDDVGVRQFLKNAKREDILKALNDAKPE